VSHGYVVKKAKERAKAFRGCSEERVRTRRKQSGTVVPKTARSGTQRLAESLDAKEGGRALLETEFTPLPRGKGGGGAN